MDEAGPDTKLCKKELRKQKLMEYLAAKGKLKPPNPKPYLRDDYPGKKSTMSALEPANGKENQRATAVIKHEVTNTVKAAIHVLQTTGKANVKQSFTKGGILSASQRVNGASAPTVLTRPPAVEGKPLVKKTYTIAALKVSAANNQRPKQSGILVKPAIHPSTVKSGASSAQQTITHPHRTSHAKSGSIATHYVVETKKGTFPAGPRPRTVQSNSTQGCSAITTASNTTRVRSTSAPSAPKANPSTALHKPFQCVSTVVRAASLISHDRPVSRGHAKPVSNKPLQPSQLGLPSAAGKQTLLSTRATTATVRLDLTHRVGKPAGALRGKPVRGTADERPGAKVEGRARQAVAGSGMRAGTKSQRGGGFTGGPGNHLGEKGQVRKVNKADTGTIPPKRTATSSPPVVPQTLPRCGTRVPKTPGLQGCRAPQTEGKKSTAAQEERMKKLQEWRDTKGISYKRPPMPVRPQSRRTLAQPQPYWSTMGEEDEAHSLICAVDRSLGDCIKLLTEGCSPEHVTKVLSRLPPLAKKFAKYWICQARLMERQGNLDVLPMFEEAVRLVLEPVDDLRTVVFDILKKRDERAKERMEEEDQEVAQRDAASLGPDAVSTPQPGRALIQGEKGYSSAVKYKITATPGGGRSQQRGRFRVDGQEVRFFTPVRRSVRIERASLGYPAYLREQDLCVASYDDLLAEDKLEGSGERQGASGEAPGHCTATPMYVYRENEALQDQVMVRLVYDDDE